MVAQDSGIGWSMGRLSFSFLRLSLGGVFSICRVSFTDGADMTHTVTVSASWLFEAAALGIAEFKRSGFAFTSIGPTDAAKDRRGAAGDHA
jgi:hypothetical protein